MTPWLVPLLVDILGGWLRAALIAFGTWAIHKHLMTASQSDSLTSELLEHAKLALPIVLALAWTTFRKYAGRVQLLTALQAAAGTSESQLAATMAAGKGASIKDTP